jgi:hypothetical protein
MNAVNKTSDDYKAKVRLWARNPQVTRSGVVPDLPRFGCVKFNSYDAMNAWKKEYLKIVARQGGCRWKKS